MKRKNTIYLDNNATTPIDRRVLTAMLADFSDHPLNPSSAHFFGRQARGLLAAARKTIANYLEVKPSEIIFTSGGTESLNLLIRGALEQYPSGHIISSNLDHACVYNTVQACERKGYSATYLSPGVYGAPTAAAVAAAMQHNTRLVVLSAANSETGVKLAIGEIAAIAEQAGIPLILDGVALLGKESIQLPPGVMGMGFSGHKIHGPKGVGFAFARADLALQAQLLGGGQEESRRSGTENLAGILGLAKAIAILEAEGAPAARQMARLQTQLEVGLRRAIPQLIINGTGPRIVNTSNIAFPGIEGEVLLAQLDQLGIAVSHGSACASGALEPSRVLLNMGLSRSRAASSLRFSLSRMNTEADIETTIDTIASLVNKTVNFL
ncbi:MAG: cysteine desulfurase family protein [Chlamydiota bacterium]